MFGINMRGTYAVLAGVPAAPEEVDEPAHPHPVAAAQHEAALVQDHVAYTMAKYGMSMCVLGMAEEFKRRTASP